MCALLQLYVYPPVFDSFSCSFVVFSCSDFNISMQQLDTFISEYDDVPFSMLQFMIAHINYGGRITDKMDARTVRVILEVCIPV